MNGPALFAMRINGDIYIFTLISASLTRNKKEKKKKNSSFL
jgi:hypothetical protein